MLHCQLKGDETLPSCAAARGDLGEKQGLGVTAKTEGQMSLQSCRQASVAAARTVETPKAERCGSLGSWDPATGVGWLSGHPRLGLQDLLVLLKLRPETWIGFGYRAGTLHCLERKLQTEAAVPHKVGGADGSGAAAAVLAVHEAGAACSYRSLHGGTGGLQVRQQVLSRVVEHGHAQLGHSRRARARLLTGDVDAQSDALMRQLLRGARGARASEKELRGNAHERQWHSLCGPELIGSSRAHRARPPTRDSAGNLGAGCGGSAGPPPHWLGSCAGEDRIGCGWAAPLTRYLWPEVRLLLA